MADATKVFICELLEEEARKALELEGLEDVQVIPYRADFEDAQKSVEDLKSKLRERVAPGDVVCIFGSEWILSPARLEKLATGHSFFSVGSCFEMTVGPSMLDVILAKGSYILIPGMLRRWPEMVRAHGNERPAGGLPTFEGMTSLVLLDTGAGGDHNKELEDLAKYVKRPHSTIAVGLDFLRLKLSSAVLGARLQHQFDRAKEEGIAQARMRSEYAMAFDLLERISQGQEEEQVAGSILDILQMLFSPAEVDYYAIHPSGRVLVFEYDQGRFKEIRDELASPLLENLNAWDEASNGFRLKVENKDRTLGVAVLRNLSFPEFRREYISLASQLSSVFGLAVANSRAFESLKDSEAQVERAFALERTMLSISQGFFGRQDFDRAVSEALARVGEAVGSSRVQLLRFSKDMRTLSCTHEWVAPGVPEAKGRLSTISVDSKDWLMERLQTEGTVRVLNLPMLNEEERAQIAPFIEAGVKAMAVAAVSVEGRRQGLACLQYVGEKDAWDTEETSMLRFLAQTLSVALQRLKAQEDLALMAEAVTMSNKVLRHDIRNELMVLNGSLQLYDMKKEERHLDRAKRSSGRLTEILDHFKELDSFLQSSHALFQVDLREVIVKTMAEYPITYEVVGDGRVDADFAINSVLDNLVRNALRHGEAKRITFRIALAGAFLELTVADDGRGIPKEARERLFQEGFSYGEKRSTGLGLFWIRKTMERYGGWVRLADSERGATFVLGFPQA